MKKMLAISFVFLFCSMFSSCTGTYATRYNTYQRNIVGIYDDNYLYLHSGYPYISQHARFYYKTGLYNNVYFLPNYNNVYLPTRIQQPSNNVNTGEDTRYQRLKGH